jgi:hypothetical protein
MLTIRSPTSATIGPNPIMMIVAKLVILKITTPTISSLRKSTS